MIADSQLMELAIELAKKGQYTTRTNPRVGAVIVKNDAVVGAGWHHSPGSPHAETHALKRAGVNAKGADCYVTLEPCYHQGKTGPCVKALIDAGIRRVIYGQEDPNPKVGGQSLTLLRELSIDIVGPVMDAQCRALNPGFNKRMSTGLPWVRIKSAMSMDARTAMANGQSFWITGPKARRDVQLLRAQSCAVITSWVTVKRDEASMTVRPKEFNLDSELADIQQPVRIILDSQFQADLNTPFFNAGGEVIIVTAKSVSQQLPEHIKVMECPNVKSNNTSIDLLMLLHQLAELGFNEVLVEAGATLSGAFVRQGLFDELWVYMAPKLMGSRARPLFDIPLEVMDEALPMHIERVESIGRDLKILFLPEKE